MLVFLHMQISFVNPHFEDSSDSGGGGFLGIVRGIQVWKRAISFHLNPQAGLLSALNLKSIGPSIDATTP